MQTKAQNETLLLEVLKDLAPDSSVSTLRSWIEKGRVTVDGKGVARANHVVKQGQMVKIGPRVNFIRGGIKILFEDEHLVVIEKPEGLLSVATDFKSHLTAHDVLKRRFHAQRVFPVHRLDRETSGVMVFAYTEAARDSFKAQFEQHSVEKVYYAVVERPMPEDQGTWKSYLKENDCFFVSSTPWQEEGKLAITHYRVEVRNKQFSLLRLNLETGRKNQIRVHCKEAGHPIVGDKKYGASSNPAKRMCLHSQKLSFTHPATKQKMTFEIAFPSVFYKLLNINLLYK